MEKINTFDKTIIGDAISRLEKYPKFMAVAQVTPFRKDELPRVWVTWDTSGENRYCNDYSRAGIAEQLKARRMLSVQGVQSLTTYKVVLIFDIEHPEYIEDVIILGEV